MEPTFEHVLRVDDCFDGVREGVALYRGEPHHFVWLGWESERWDSADDHYRVSPVPRGAGPATVVRPEFRNPLTAPDPQCPPLVPQEVRWTPATVPSAS